MNRNISEKSLQLDALDGLRGFAALIVILSHTSNASMFFVPFFNAYGIGKSGVFLFFLLSSFLLSRALIKQGANAFTIKSISHYSQRRFFRIYPLYFSYLFMGVITTIIFSMLLNRDDTGIPFSLSISEFLNHLFLQDGKGVTWSIAVEFKFYFVLPVIIFLCHMLKTKVGYIFEVLFLLCLVAITQVISPQWESVGNDSRLLPYMCIFLIGTVLAVIQCEIESRNIDKNNLKLIVPLSYLSVAMLIFMTPTVASFILEDVGKRYFHKDFIQYAVLWGIVLLSVINFNSKLSSFFKMKWLCFYGSLSFSIYLFHPIFIHLANYLPLNEYISAWFVLSGSTLVSYISFKCLELPASNLHITHMSLNSVNSQ
ncbi:acyltransferase [Pseudoalteromonas sp. C2R02]|uniref:acyltransferase family protein n=1 Tax=Pseudoalteromonas sp. C2R02 TaxID=2841565 RepID=UPI001C0986B8|nr:acyltransferase [Pseudoalteromonas sp. C2R02]MBU2967850.1 acyltransferase [Pseudoalteromonas sp. C2R02]